MTAVYNSKWVHLPALLDMVLQCCFSKRLCLSPSLTLPSSGAAGPQGSLLASNLHLHLLTTSSVSFPFFGKDTCVGEVNVTPHRIISLLCVRVPVCVMSLGGMCADVWVETENSLGCSQSCPPCLFYFISFCGICRLID